jgi:hypothetical protein
MRTARRLAIVCVSVVTAGLLGVPAYADAESDERDFGGQSLDGGFAAVGSHLSMRIDDSPMTTSSATEEAVETAYEEARFQCALRQASDESGDLLNEETDLCEDEEGGITTADLVALVSSEFKTLPLASPAISYQPEGDWALVNMDFIVYTDADQQLLSTTILGVPVTVRATPVHYSWDFGDGSAPLSTTDTGRPYPDHTLAHVYTSTTDAVEVTLTTSWQGELQINGAGPWLPIAGIATTTSTAPPVEIVAMDVNLVP